MLDFVVVVPSMRACVCVCASESVFFYLFFSVNIETLHYGLFYNVLCFVVDYDVLLCEHIALYARSDERTERNEYDLAHSTHRNTGAHRSRARACLLAEYTDRR